MQANIFDWTDIVQGIQNGNQQAFEELYRKTLDRLKKRIQFKLGFDEQTTEDLIQETYIEIYKSIKSLNEPNAVVKWCEVICDRVSIERYRKDAHRKELADIANESDLAGEDDDEEGFSFDQIESEVASVEDQIELKEVQRILAEIIVKLPELQRTCIELQMEGMSTKEIAYRIKIPEGSVKTNIFRAKKKIKEEVTNLEKRGIKLYSFSPVAFFAILYFIFRKKEVYAADMIAFTKIQESLGVAGGVAATSATVATANTATVAGLGVGKIVAIVAATVIVAGGIVTGCVIGFNNNNNSQISVDSTTTKAEVTSEVNTEEITAEEITAEETAESDNNDELIEQLENDEEFVEFASWVANLGEFEDGDYSFLSELMRGSSPSASYCKNYFENYITYEGNYTCIDEKDFRWIAKNILNCSDEEIDSSIEEYINENGIINENGVIKSFISDPGGEYNKLLGIYSAEKKDNKFEVEFYGTGVINTRGGGYYWSVSDGMSYEGEIGDIYKENYKNWAWGETFIDEIPIAFLQTMVFEKKTIDGKEYWTVDFNIITGRIENVADENGNRLNWELFPTDDFIYRELFIDGEGIIDESFVSKLPLSSCNDIYINDMVVGDEKITGIEEGAFNAPDVNIESLLIDLSELTEIGKHTFSFGKIDIICIEDGIKEIDDEAFIGCGEVECVFFPRSIESIGNNAFPISDDFSVYGYAGTAAEDYANKNKIEFISED